MCMTSACHAWSHYPRGFELFCLRDRQQGGVSDSITDGLQTAACVCNTTAAWARQCRLGNWETEVDEEGGGGRGGEGLRH